jgi:hypothetical protein
VSDEHLSKNEFLAHMGPIQKDIAELVRLQREQNSRVSKAETEIAILKDRSPAREATGVSAVVSACVSAVINGLTVWLGAHK